MSGDIFSILALTLAFLTSSIIASPSFEDRHQIINRPSIIDDETNYRLPTTSAPSDYKINWVIDPDSPASFTGTVDIAIDVKVKTQHIVLHAHPDMTVNTVKIKENGGNEITCTFDMPTNSSHFLTVNLPSEAAANSKHNLIIGFTGKYGYMAGIYRSSYRDDGNNQRFLVTTQFQAVSAREAFPCYDEPHLKATFLISIEHPDKYHAISNRHKSGVKKANNKANSITSFFATPKMSTYLVAIVVSDFEMKSNAGNQIMARDFSIFARPSANDSLDYSLEFAQRSLADLDSWIGLPYQLTKMDKVAIPDFAAGAMENWGLVTYREEYLLHKPGVTSAYEEQFISAVISHENAHMWFGNEVTPLWWDYLWLSEGFATYFEYLTTDRVLDNKFRMMDQYVARYMQNIMHADTRNSTNPMTNTVLTPSEIDRNFNGIAYDKAGGVIRMMRHVLGETQFQQALKNYIAKHNAEGITDPKKLFDELQLLAIGLPVGVTINDIFGAWSTQKGFPMVSAMRVGSSTTVNLKQKHYSTDSLQSTDNWWIPISWTAKYEKDFLTTKPKQWLVPGADSTISLNNQEDWFILNIQHTGYYRILYDNQNWNRLIDALKLNEHDGIHYLNRAQLIDDSHSFAMAKELSYNITLDLLSYLENEEDFIPWISAERVFNYLNIIMPASENYSRYKQFTSNMIRNVYKNLGFNAKASDNEIDRMHRVIAVGIECKSGSENIRYMANDKISNVMSNSDYTIDPDLRSTIYCCGLRQSTEEQWDYILNKYSEAKRPTEAYMLLRSLGCTEDKKIANRYLQMSIENSDIKEEDRYRIVVSVINSGPIGLGYALDFILENFVTLQTKLNSGTLSIINALQENVATGDHVVKFWLFREMYYDKFTPTELSSIDISTQVIYERSAFIWKALQEIDPWLLNNVQFNSGPLHYVSKIMISICALLLIYFK